MSTEKPAERTIDARFTRGSTMRHVVVMTSTATVGLMSLFIVDLANLFYISLLGETEMAAAIGYAGTIQFFMISVSIGLAIAATATVSKAVGRGNRAEARHLAGSAITLLVLALSACALGTWIFRYEVLRLLGADGAALEIAANFLAIVLPSVPLLGIGMVSSGLLRSVGDAKRAMFVTLFGGIFGAVLDPVFIFDWGFGLGVEGAAIVSSLSRVFVAGMGLWFALKVHDIIGRPTLSGLLEDARALLAIAVPAVATQLSTPFGNAYLISVVSDFGDAAVAGWAVVGRITALGFAGLFALSGAVGPIFGQNLGAGKVDRILSTYRDALIFIACYVLVIWLAMFLLTDLIAQGFGLTGAGVEVLEAYTLFGAASYLFTGALFVSNSAFNNLGHPTWSTMFNWSRDAITIPALAFLIGGSLGATGAVTIQALSGALVGTLAILWTRRFLRHMRAEDRAKADAAIPGPVAAPYSSGRTMAITIGDTDDERLEPERDNR
ncbi:MAG: MATE family efflux transporter [Pseudomonadota bacterium]